MARGTGGYEVRSLSPGGVAAKVWGRKEGGPPRRFPPGWTGWFGCGAWHFPDGRTGRRSMVGPKTSVRAAMVGAASVLDGWARSLFGPRGSTLASRPTSTRLRPATAPANKAVSQRHGRPAPTAFRVNRRLPIRHRRHRKDVGQYWPSPSLVVTFNPFAGSPR